MTDKNTNSGFLGAMSAGHLNELRKMLLGMDAEDLARLNTLVQDPELFSDEISALLPLAIRKMLQRGDVSLADVLPLVEQALKESIQKDPKTLANILFPVMIPAIRKAVQEDITRMLSSLNTTLENRFSPQRIGWRLNALFSGNSYAAIVLSHAYVFRVKQVYLIHRETGLLLHQIVDEEHAENADADMVSSMLTAIKDFVQDSFKVDEDQSLGSIQVGTLNVWIEQGPHAIVASIVEGKAPERLRLIMKEAVEGVHVNFSYELEHFQGETSPFEKNERFVRMCLMKEEKEVKKKKPVIVIVLFALIFIALGYWAFIHFEAEMRFNNYVTELNNSPGIIITESGKTAGRYFVKGAADPLSLPPQTGIAKYGFDENDFDFTFEPYISLNPDFVLARAIRILNPPATVHLSYRSDTLYAKGKALQTWASTSKIQATLLSGVGFYNTDELSIILTHEKVKRDILAIEKHYFIFDFNVSDLDETQQLEFKNLVNEVNNVLDFSREQDTIPMIAVIAHTSYAGDPGANETVALNRAKEFIQFMSESGLPAESMMPIVSFVEDVGDTQYPVRSVSFKVNYVKSSGL